MDKETVAMVLENVFTNVDAAKYMKLSKSQFQILVENKKIQPVKDQLFYKGDLDDYMHTSYSLNNKNVKEAIFYYTMQKFCHDDEIETLHLLHTLEGEAEFDLHHPFFDNLSKVCTYLHIQEVAFYQSYKELEAYFMNLPLKTLILCKEDALYPIALKDQIDAPYFLFVLGDLSLLDKLTVGIIGSEHPREDEVKKGLYLENYLLNKDEMIVTGLERGLNTYLCLEMMKKQLSGIIVLSTSFLDIFPKENQQIYEYMAENGLVISQFIYHPYYTQNIQKRNPTLVALSDSCILMGGKDHSELCEFGEEALRQNKLLLMPSSLKKSFMHFPSEYISKGAHYFTSIKELVNIKRITI